MKKITPLGLLAGFCLLLSGLLLGCSDSSPQPGQGTMQVFLIDAPGDYDEVNIEVIEVRVHLGDGESSAGWHTVSDDTISVDLLELTNGNHAVLADSTLVAGRYTQVRLILGENNTVVVDGQTHDLEIPSGAESGLKLNHPFDIADGAIYAVTLDFDADRSIHVTGNGRYKMRPVIRLIVNNISGAIEGVVEPTESRAMVMALAGEDTVIAYADTLSGAFSFPMLVAGSYDLEFSATVGSYRDSTLTDVVVTANQNTDVGTVVLEAE